MKKPLFALLTVIAIAATPLLAVETRIATVDFKRCGEESKLGQNEQKTFEALKNQVEKNISEKEKTLKELSDKLSDEDYLDGLAPQAENELKHQFRALSQEYSQMQQQFMQALQQANYKIIQHIANVVGQASEVVAKKEGFDLIVNAENSFYYSKKLDISDRVIKEMDRIYENEKSNTSTK